jgi:hypothetical protein
MVLTMSTALISIQYLKAGTRYEFFAVDMLQTRAIGRCHFKPRLYGSTLGKLIRQGKKPLKERQRKGGSCRLQIGGYIYERPPLCLMS